LARVSSRVGAGSRWPRVVRWLLGRVSEPQPGTARASSCRTPWLTRSTQGALVARWRRTCRPVRAIVAGRVNRRSRNRLDSQRLAWCPFRAGPRLRLTVGQGGQVRPGRIELLTQDQSPLTPAVGDEARGNSVSEGQTLWRRRTGIEPAGGVGPAVADVLETSHFVAGAGFEPAASGQDRRPTTPTEARRLPLGCAGAAHA